MSSIHVEYGPIAPGSQSIDYFPQLAVGVEKTTQKLLQDELLVFGDCVQGHGARVKQAITCMGVLSVVVEHIALNISILVLRYETIETEDRRVSIRITRLWSPEHLANIFNGKGTPLKVAGRNMRPGAISE
jgi:hypothetical protein